MTVDKYLKDYCGGCKKKFARDFGIWHTNVARIFRDKIKFMVLITDKRLRLLKEAPNSTEYVIINNKSYRVSAEKVK